LCQKIEKVDHMVHSESRLLLVFLALTLISIAGVGSSLHEPGTGRPHQEPGAPPQGPVDTSNCISQIDIVVYNSEEMTPLEGAIIYINGKKVGTASSGQFSYKLSHSMASSLYTIEAKKTDASGCYSGEAGLPVPCSDPNGARKSIKIYAEKC
jgi:hypothetical protein